MKKWELAKYLIDAKKDVDSIMYLACHGKEVYNIDLKSKIDRLLADFYINCCVVLDNTIGKKKKETCSYNPLIAEIYYECDKNSAHKDENYKNKHYSSLQDIVDDLKIKILEVKDICAGQLPDVISLDFVPHDRETFRLIHGLTTEKEEEINKIKHPLKDCFIPKEATLMKTVLNDISELKDIPEDKRNDYCTIIEDGINSFEGLQNRQDWAIKTNLLFNLDIWINMNDESLKKMQKLHELGIYDDFDVMHLEKLEDELVIKELDKLFGRKEN